MKVSEGQEWGKKKGTRYKTLIRQTWKHLANDLGVHGKEIFLSEKDEKISQY